MFGKGLRRKVSGQSGKDPDVAEILVLGSLNVDFVVRAPHRPGAGETVTGLSFELFPGGKGANQAVAAARAGARVAMAGAVGDDVFRDIVIESLRRAGVSLELLETIRGIPTGSAFITVDNSGENSIVVVPGANGRCSADYARSLEPVLRRTRILMLQMEIPVQTNVSAAAVARDAGVLVFLDPAPPLEIPESLWELVDVVTPNEHEASRLTGIEVRCFEDAERAARILLERGPARVVVKMGARGALAAERDASGKVAFLRHRAFPVPVVDTTAAGDAFSGALAVAVLESNPWEQAVRFAGAAGALSVTKPGAQTSLPAREEIERFLALDGKDG